MSLILRADLYLVCLSGTRARAGRLRSRKLATPPLKILILSKCEDEFTTKGDAVGDTVEKLADALTNHYVHQKELILERAKVRRELDRDRLWSLVRPKMLRMAELVKDWSIDPELIMESAFAYARSKRHADGPMPTMLYSVKYLTKAIGYRLGVPYEAVMDLQDQDLMFRDLDEAYEQFVVSYVDSEVDLVFASSLPTEHRYLLAMHRMDFRAVVQLTPQLLENMENNRLLTLWMERRKLSYKKISNIFNQRTKNATKP